MNKLPENFRRAMLRPETLRTNDKNLPSRNPELPERQECQGSKTSDHAPVRAELERRDATGDVGKGKAKGGDSRRFLVRITSVRRRLIDEDNLCEKYVVDCARYAGAIPDDSPGTTRIETRQLKAEKEEDERTIVEIFELTTPTQNV